MANAGAWLAILGGLIILISGLMYYTSPGAYSVLAWYVTGTAGTALAVVSGLLALVGGWMLSKGNKMGGALALMFSLVSFAVGGGWVIGGVLGVVGSLWGWKK